MKYEDDTRGLAEARSARGDMDALEHRFADVVRGRIVMWAIRWTIGFGIVWAVTSWTGQYYWLWIAGAVVAVISLAINVGFLWFMNQQFSQTADRVTDLENALPDDHLAEADQTKESEIPNGKL